MNILYNKTENKFNQYDKDLLGDPLWQKYQKKELEITKDYNLDNFGYDVFQKIYKIHKNKDNVLSLTHNNKKFNIILSFEKHTLNIKVDSNCEFIYPYYKELNYVNEKSEKIKSNNLLSKFTTFFHWCDIIEDYISFLSDTIEIENKEIYFEYQGNKNKAIIIKPTNSYRPIEINNLGKINQTVKFLGFYGHNNYSDRFLDKLKKTKGDFLNKKRLKDINEILNKID